MLCDRFVQADTRDYASFRQSFKLTPPQNFNFGFDVVDAIAAKTPPAACTSPFPTRGGPRPAGARSTASGCVNARCSPTISTGSTL